MVKTLIRKDLLTHHENLVEKTLERYMSLNCIMRKSNGHRQITATKKQNAEEERTQDKIKTKTQEFCKIENPTVK